MIGTRGPAPRKIVSLFVAVLVGMMLAQLGGRVRLGADQPPRTDLPPETYRGDVDRDSRQDVIAYARTLQFSDATGAGDEQRLVVVTDSAHDRGPLVRVEPAVGIDLSAREQLANGLVIARLINRDTVPYPALAIGARDTTYWWADSVAPGRWRAVYFSSDPAIPPVELGLHLQPAPDDERHRFSLSARWLFADEGERPWVTCGAGMACRAGNPIGG